MSGWGFKNKHQEQTIPTKFYDAKFSDYSILNEDEVLNLILEKALNSGWKFFGYWDKGQYPFNIQFEIFDGDITIFYNITGITGRNELAYFTLDDLITNESFMKAYYGLSHDSKIIVVSSDGEELAVQSTHYHMPAYKFHMEEIKTFSDKLKWLFANTGGYFGGHY